MLMPVGARRSVSGPGVSSLCRGPALFVSGPGGRSLSVGGPARLLSVPALSVAVRVGAGVRRTAGQLRSACHPSTHPAPLRSPCPMPSSQHCGPPPIRVPPPHRAPSSDPRATHPAPGPKLRSAPPIQPGAFLCPAVNTTNHDVAAKTVIVIVVAGKIPVIMM